MTVRFNLTKQEYCVLSYLNEGLSVKAVAKKLELSSHTVNGHMKSIYFKLNVKSRGQAQHKFNERKMAAANDEKADRAAELVIANDEKANRAAELEAILLGKHSARENDYHTELSLLTFLNSLAMARDNETRSHILRTQHYVKSLALRLKEMGHYKKELSDEMIELLFKAAALHDIGKVGIPNSILHKPGRLNDEEWRVMKTHASIGRAILTSAELETHGGSGVVTIAMQIAGDHHEKWDGSGYPSGLKGEQIALPARIMALADVFDASMSKRIYKAACNFDEVVSEIISQRGAHFDPLVVDAFIMERTGFLAIHSQHKDD
jgi:response regulator RpfG family c-di-GMP phosphodiesterase